MSGKCPSPRKEILRTPSEEANASGACGRDAVRLRLPDIGELKEEKVNTRPYKVQGGGEVIEEALRTGRATVTTRTIFHLKTKGDRTTCYFLEDAPRGFF